MGACCEKDSYNWNKDPELKGYVICLVRGENIVSSHSKTHPYVRFHVVSKTNKKVYPGEPRSASIWSSVFEDNGDKEDEKDDKNNKDKASTASGHHRSMSLPNDKAIDRFHRYNERRYIYSSVRHDESNPIWNSYRFFMATPSDTLVFAIKDEIVVLMDQEIGQSTISMQEIIDNDKICNFGNKEDETNDKKLLCLSMENNVKFYFRIFRYNKENERNNMKKKIFVIRHGESKFNDSLHANILDVKKKISLWTDMDHALNEKGIEQSIELNKRWKNVTETLTSSLTSMNTPGGPGGPGGPNDETKIDSKRNEENELNDLLEFRNAEMIISSPLARAIQTAYLALYDHPSIVENEKKIVICRNTREIRQFRFDFTTGKDSVSTFTGEQIVENALELLKKEHGKRIASFIDMPLNENDSNGHNNGDTNGDNNGNETLETPKLNLTSVSSVISQEINEKVRYIFDKLNEILVDFNDAYSQWWASMPDNAFGGWNSELADRYFDFIEFIRYRPEKTFIVVTHSLFLRRLFKEYLVKPEIIGTMTTRTHRESSKRESSKRESSKQKQNESIENSIENGNKDETQNNQNNKKSAVYRQTDGAVDFTSITSTAQLVNQENAQIEFYNQITETKKLANAACAALDVEFHDNFKDGMRINDVRLLWDAQLM